MGRKRKYEPAMCDTVLELMKQGFSKVQICVELGISRPVFYEWINPEGEWYVAEFAEAVETGMVYAQAFWENELKKAALGENKDANATLMIYNMKNRFRDDWADVQRVESNVNFAQVSDTPVNSEEWLSAHKPK